MKSELRFTRQAVLAAAACLFSPAIVHAQTSDMPPKLEQIDELESPSAAPASVPDANPSAPRGRQIIEKRERGQVTSIEVRSGEHSYYINPAEQAGTVVPGDAQSATTRTPQWKIFEFDLKRPTEPNAAPQAQPAPSAPPAPVK